MDTASRSDLRASHEQLNAMFERRFVGFEAKVEQRIRELERRMDDREAKITRAWWWFAAWVALFIPLIGLWIRG